MSTYTVTPDYETNRLRKAASGIAGIEYEVQADSTDEMLERLREAILESVSRYTGFEYFQKCKLRMADDETIELRHPGKNWMPMVMKVKIS